MLFEREIRSIPDLIREVRILDLDAGIRVVGEYNGEKCYVFVTRYGKGHITMVFERKRDSRLGKRLLTREFENVAELEKFLRAATRGGVKAFSY